MKSIKLSKQQEEDYYEFKNKWKIWCIIVIKNAHIFELIPAEIRMMIINICELRNSEINVRMICKTDKISLSENNIFDLHWEYDIFYSFKSV